MKINARLSIVFILLIGTNIATYSQNVAITDDAGYTADPSAMLDVKSTTKGFLPPRLTTIQRDAIPNPAAGLVIYNSIENSLQIYSGGEWKNVAISNANLNGNNLEITDASGTTIIDLSSLINDADASPTNEIQTLSISNDTIYLTDGSFVKLPADVSFSGSFNDLTNVPANLDTDATDDVNNGDNISLLTNDAAYITDGNTNWDNSYGYITSPDDADADPANELQLLSLSNDTLYLSNGNYVVMPYDSTIWSRNGADVYYNSGNVGVGTSAPPVKFFVKGDATGGAEEPIFAIANADGDTIFAVYPDGVRINVSDDPAKATGSRSGFAVGGFSLTKGETNEYLRVTPDSVRVYVSEGDPAKATGSKGGFAVGGFSLTKGMTNEYLRVTDDSVRVYIEDDPVAKATANRGGFAVGGFSLTKGANDSLYLFSDQGGLNVNFLSETERDAIVTPRISSIIFNTTDSCLQIFLGYWESIWCTPMGCVLPAVLTQPVNDTAVAVPAIFAISAVGSKIYYKWQESTDGGITWKVLSDGGTNPSYSGCSTDTLIIDNIPETYYGYQYRCYVSNACGNEISSAATLINCYPPSISIQPVNDTLFFPENSMVVSVSASGEPLYYEWQESIDGGSTWSSLSDGGSNPDYTGTGSNTLIISNIPDSCGYKYRCLVSNSCGGILSDVTSIIHIVNIGDNFGGGIVFYTSGSDIYISATSDQSTAAAWGCQGTYITPATGMSIGDGEQNTITIDAGCTTPGIAADICANLVLNGYDDWFLPSRDELSQLYIRRAVIGGFSLSWYWSSSQFDTNSARDKLFSSGTQDYSLKSYGQYVRCIRSQ